MSQGIFEQLLAAQLQTNVLLEEICRGMGKTPTVTLEQTVDAVVEQASTTPTEVKADVSAPEVETGVVLDKDGVPWDERIHSSNKKQTAKNLWQKKKGVDAAYHAEITAQLKNGRELAAAQTEAIEQGTPVPAPDKPAALAPAPAPTPAAGAAPAPAPAPQPAADVQLRKTVVDAIDGLCKGYDRNSTSTLQVGVDIETINVYLTEYYGAPTFAEVEPTHYQQMLSQIEQWHSELELVNTQIRVLLEIYAADVSLIAPHIVNVLGHANSGQVDFSKIIDTRSRLTAYVATVQESVSA